MAKGHLPKRETKKPKKVSKAAVSPVALSEATTVEVARKRRKPPKEES